MLEDYHKPSRFGKIPPVCKPSRLDRAASTWEASNTSSAIGSSQPIEPLIQRAKPNSKGA
jgi:hypothetical protein